MILRLTTTFAVLCALALGASSPSLAQSGKAKGGKPAKAEKVLKTKGNTGGSSNTSDAVSAAAAAGATLAGILLSDDDKATITKYFQDNPRPAKPLPPGIAKNVARGKPLPPGIAKRGVANALTSNLSLPKGYDLETVGTDVVLIEAGTRVIADVLKDVLRQ